MKDKEILESAEKRFKIAADAESDIREQSLSDMKFAAGEQWDDQIKMQRKLQGRPALTINRIPQFIHQITNDQRQNRPSIQVNPVDDYADVETAEVIQGIIRHIEYNSGADMAYDSAFENGVTSGYGFFRITTDYADEMTFDQEVYIRRVQNPFSVYFDPGCSEPDYSDASFCFVTMTYTKEEFEAKWPNAEGESFTLEATGDGWIEKDRVRVAEYFWREEETVTIELWAGLRGQQVFISGKVPSNLPPDMQFVSKRKTQIPFIKWALLTSGRILQKTDWPGKWIPIIPVIGKELFIDGERILKGIVRDARDPQQQYNFMTTAATEAIALAPKAPFIGTAKQFENYEREWQSMNTTNRPFLRVNVDSQAPTVFPQRQQAEPPVQAMMEAVAHASDDMKSTTGIYDASLGARGNEISGKGILARQQQSQSGNFHYIDNLSRSLRHAGRILIDLIPKVYSSERVLRIIGEDGTQKTVMVNAQKKPDGSLPEGVTNIYDLTVGKYDVMISTGPSYQTKRQEAVTSMVALVGQYPQLMQYAGDILVGNMDWPGADEIAARLRRTIPPQIADDPEGMEGVPPEIKQQFGQLMAQMQQLQQQNQQLQMEQQMQLEPKKLEAESRERVEFEKLAIQRQKIEADLALGLAQLNQQKGEHAIDTQLRMLDQAIAADANMQKTEEEPVQ